MAIRHLAIGAAALILSARTGHAGPCAEAIARMQHELDARIEAVIDTARFARDARRALGLPMPTLGTTKSGPYNDASWMGLAVAALARGGDAGRNRHGGGCGETLAAPPRAISRLTPDAAAG